METIVLNIIFSMLVLVAQIVVSRSDLYEDGVIWLSHVLQKIKHTILTFPVDILSPFFLPQWDWTVRRRYAALTSSWVQFRCSSRMA